MPTSGDLKYEDSLFCIIPPPKKNDQAPLTSTIPPPPTIKHKLTQSAN